jgi:hypothetical protein
LTIDIADARSGVDNDATDLSGLVAGVTGLQGWAEPKRGRSRALPEHVVTLVRFVACPASEARQRSTVHRLWPDGDVGRGTPATEAHFRAESDVWTPADLRATLGDYFADRDPKRGFPATGLMESGDDSLDCQPPENTLQNASPHARADQP